MKIEVESTEDFQDIGGNTFVRLWRGKDSKGQEVVAFIHHIAMRKTTDNTEAIADLRPVPMTGLEQTWACTKEDIDGGKKPT